MKRAPDCDMVLVHDDDLAMIDELRHAIVSRHLIENLRVVLSLCWQSSESLESDAMMDLLRRSSIEIRKDLCGGPASLIESSLLILTRVPTQKICHQAMA